MTLSNVKEYKIDCLYLMYKAENGVRWYKAMARKTVKKENRQARLADMGQQPAVKKAGVRRGRREKGRAEPAVQHLTGLLGRLPQAVCVFDKYGTIAYCNESFAALAGRPLKKLIGRKLRKNTLWGLPGQPDEFRELFLRAKESRQPLLVQALPVNRDGQAPQYWDLEFNPHISKKKKIEGMSLLVEDVTPERSLKNKRELLNDYYAAALHHNAIQPLLEDLIGLLKDFSGCPAVQILILDRYSGKILKASSESGPGLWDSGQELTPAAVESLFSRAHGAAESYFSEDGCVYVANISAAGNGLSGSLKERVTNARNSYGYNSLALVPVILEGRPGGYIQLASPKEDGVAAETLRAVKNIAGHLQVILELVGLKEEGGRQRQSLLKQVYERSAHLESLNQRLKQEAVERKRAQEEAQVQRDLAIALNGIENMPDALQLCLDTAISVSGIDSGGIYIADPVAGGFKLAVNRGLSEDFSRVVSYYSAAAPNAQIIFGGKAIYARHQDLGTPMNEALLKEGLRGAGIIPIMHGGKAVACLNIASHVFDEIPFNARNALESMAAYLGTFIAHISDREGLAESEERYRTLFACTLNPILVIDTEGNYIDGNDAALDFLECAREEFLSMSVKNTLPPYLDEHWYEQLRNIWLTGGTVERDYYVWGKIKVLELTITPLQVGGRKTVIGIGKDITERKKVEAALKESEEKYRSVVENAGEAIFVVQDSIIKFANQRSLELMQYSMDDLSARPLQDFIHPEDRHRVVERYLSRLNGEDVEPVCPFRIIDKNGSAKWVELRVSPMQWENKPAILTFITDATERWQAGQQGSILP